jgi:6,7-dimethyl-8-ribityllumazine synthase
VIDFRSVLMHANHGEILLMLKSLHIGRYVTKPEDFRVLAKFLETVGFHRVSEGKGEHGHSAVFSAPAALLSVNALPEDYPADVLNRLKDVARLIVIEVSNADVVFDVASKMNLRVLADRSANGQRSFSVELPGEIVVTVHGQLEDEPGTKDGQLDATGKRFGIVVSRFNAFITDRLLAGALDGLTRTGARREDIEIVRVPGAFEIPSAARTLAQTGKYDAIICIGCLLRGDTAHYDVIVNEATRGIGQSAQETGVPHAFGVLTCDTLEQAIDRAGLKMGNKGFEASLAAVEMANLKKAVSTQDSALSGRKARKAAKKTASQTHPRRRKS